MLWPIRARSIIETSGVMAEQLSRRERLLLAVVVLIAVIVLADIIVLNVVGDLPSGWWPLAVPVGLFLVPVIGVVCLAL